MGDEFRFGAAKRLCLLFSPFIDREIQKKCDSSMQERYLREEAAELYSLSIELLVMDKLNIFYKQDDEYKEVQRVQLYRTLSLLMSSVAGDVFQHWLYANPNHTPEERDKKYMELCERYQYSSVDIVGLEDEISSSWLESFHFM